MLEFRCGVGELEENFELMLDIHELRRPPDFFEPGGVVLEEFLFSSWPLLWPRDGLCG